MVLPGPRVITALQSARLTRRRLLQYAGLAVPSAVLASSAMLAGCERHRYERPCEELDLGPVKSLLYRRVHMRNQAVVVNRDIDGWSVLSARCTYIGCDLTYQEPVLLCPCCKTRFDLNGVPYAGWSATVALPWCDVYHRDGHLFANPCKHRSPTWRFTTPEIETAIRELRKHIKTEGLGDEVKVPEVLLGASDGEVGGQFLEDDPNVMHSLDMIK